MTDRARSRSTKIEWTQHTWNPMVGCSLASAGCTNCYAMRAAHRIESLGTAPSYRGLTTTAKGGPVWTGKVARASTAAMRKPLAHKSPSLFFVNSMSDMFHPDMNEDWQLEAFEIMAQTPRHTYQILTKRPEVAAAFYERNRHVQTLPNVWLGVSVERQDAVWRVDVLNGIPAAVRFLSVEPLIGPIERMSLLGISWVITGGESGPGARPCRPDWVRAVRDMCGAANVPLFHKQWGIWANNPLIVEDGFTTAKARGVDLDPEAKGGATLDGRLHREIPQSFHIRGVMG